jgi:hypothetical protein
MFRGGVNQRVQRGVAIGCLAFLDTAMVQRCMAWLNKRLALKN